MQTKATLRHLRIAPRKVRLVGELIRGKKVSEAQIILRFCTKSAASVLEKILRSALASVAYHVPFDESNLYIADIVVNEGPKLKRYRPRARGRAYEIQRKTSHITLVLNEVVPTARESKEPRGIARKTSQETRQARIEKPRFKPAQEVAKPKTEGGLKRIFRRKTA